MKYAQSKKKGSADASEPKQQIFTLDELRRRQLREARSRAFWAGRTLAMRHSTRKAA